MSNSAKYVSLKTVVSYFLDECDKSIGDFDKAWVMAFRGLNDIGYNIAFEPKSVRLPMNGNLTATLPSDYIMWTKIGVINASGEVSTLRVNNSLTKFADNHPDRLSKISPDIPDSNLNNLVLNPYFFNYFSGGYFAPMFGLGGGLVQYGECVVDEKNMVIVMSPTYPFGDVLLEYISNPQQDNDYQIEVVCQEALIAFIKWKFKLAPEREYYSRMIEARRKLKPIRLQEIQQAIRQNTKYCLKA